MLRRFKRSARKVRKGPKQPAALVGNAPAWCAFNTEAREFGEEVCSRRNMLTKRPDAWQAWPEEEAGVVYLVPGEKSDENFEYQWSKDGQRSWVNLIELFEELDINMLPDRPERFPVTIEERPTIGWALAVHFSKRAPADEDDLAEVDQDAAAGGNPGAPA